MKQDLKRQLQNLKINKDHAAKEHAEAQRKHQCNVKTLEADKARSTTLKNQRIEKLQQRSWIIRQAKLREELEEEDWGP